MAISRAISAPITEAYFFPHGINFLLVGVTHILLFVSTSQLFGGVFLVGWLISFLACIHPDQFCIFLISFQTISLGLIFYSFLHLQILASACAQPQLAVQTVQLASIKRSHPCMGKINAAVKAKVETALRKHA